MKQVRNHPTFIGLTLTDGTDIGINVDHIERITKDATTGGTWLLLRSGVEELVKESVQEVVEAIYE